MFRWLRAAILGATLVVLGLTPTLALAGSPHPGVIPPIFDPEQVNRKFLVDSSNLLRTNRELTSREGIFAGISSGAVVYDNQAGDAIAALGGGSIHAHKP